MLDPCYVAPSCEGKTSCQMMIVSEASAILHDERMRRRCIISSALCLEGGLLCWCWQLCLAAGRDGMRIRFGAFACILQFVKLIGVVVTHDVLTKLTNVCDWSDVINDLTLSLLSQES